MKFGFKMLLLYFAVLYAKKVLNLNLLEKPKEELKDFERFESYWKCLVSNGLNTENFVHCFGHWFSTVFKKIEGDLW